MYAATLKNDHLIPPLAGVSEF